MDPSKFFLEIELNPITFQINSFEFIRKDDPECKHYFTRSDGIDLQDKDKYWYRYRVDVNPKGRTLYCFSMNWREFAPREYAHVSMCPYPEWPWIAAQLTRKEEGSGWITLKKWDLLITAVDTLRTQYKGSLERFKAPELKAGAPFKPRFMEHGQQWLQEFNNAKLRQWKRLVALSPGPQVALPRFTIEDVAWHSRHHVQQSYSARDWEVCSWYSCGKVGGNYRLKKCAGCGCLPGRQVLYCSRECQRADWPNHRRSCKEVAVRRYEDAIRNVRSAGMEPRVWKNIDRLVNKRAEGLSRIHNWAFSQVYMSFPDLNLKEICLDIYYRSTRMGKGKILPVSFQLLHMSRIPGGVPPEDFFRNNIGRKFALVQYWIDGVFQVPQRVDLASEAEAEGAFYSKQWPWILGTIAAMENHHSILAECRLMQLLFAVDVLAKASKMNVPSYQVPSNLNDGQLWKIYDFEAWNEIFCDVIAF